ncbi:MAG: response regulator [Gemmatimonadales bacterium]|nr:response regulator [Gemmatimonadales bacterium]
MKAQGRLHTGFIRLTALSTAILCAVALLGWQIGRLPLQNGFSRGAPINPVIALVLLLGGLALLAEVTDRRGLRRLGAAAAGVMAAIAFLRMAEVFFEWPLPGPVDLLFFPSKLTHLPLTDPTRMSGGTALVLVLLAVAIVLAPRKADAARFTAKALAILIGVLGALAILGYISRRAQLSDSAGTVPVAFSTALGLLLLSFAVFATANRAEELDTGSESINALQRRVTLAVRVALLILTLSAGVSIWMVQRSREAAKARRDALNYRETLQAILSTLTGAETGQRGYLLTGRPEYLGPQESANESTSAQLPRLREQVGSDSVQAARYAALERTVRSKLALLDRTIALRRAGHADSALAIVQTGEGIRGMDEIRRIVREMLASRDALVARWDRRLERDNQISLVMSFLVGLLAIVFLVVAGRTINRDLTRRGFVEEERDRFFTISVDLLCIAKSDGYFKRLNPAFTEVLGWSNEELLARPFIDFVHPDDHAATLREVERQTVEGEPVLHFENRYLHKDGSWRVLSWRSVPQPGGLLYATARDVTDRRQVETVMRAAKEAAEASNRAKSDFLAKMSHELRTPLNSIIGFSEILEDETAGTLTDKQRRYVGNVLLSGRNLLQLINDILDLSKVESGRMELTITEFSVQGALEQVRNVVMALADRKRLQLTLEVEPGLPPLKADEGKFRQILYNLLGNAIKFTGDDGRVIVTARTVPWPDGTHGQVALEVSVADTGIGIAPEDHERIFEEFRQVGRGSARDQEGTGLGLALTKKLLALHGGRITVQSALGKGSTFRATLPFRAPPPKVEPAPPAAIGVPDGRPAGPLVLVVDDEPGARDLLIHHLREAGYRVATAGSGEEALNLARTLGPDAITLDILLPDRDGLLTLAELKSRAETRSIPILIVSVTGRTEVGYSLGAADWLVKPVDRGTLLGALDRALRQEVPGGKRRILVIDDERAALDYTVELLEGRGYHVFTAADGRQGIERAVAERPDLVILDLMMPGLNGFEVIDALRAHADVAGVPILIVTAKDLNSSELDGLRRSVQGVVRKGGREALLAELARVCPARGPVR